MKIYMAGTYASNFGNSSNMFRKLTEEIQANYAKLENRLESYHYIKRVAIVERLRKDKITVFLDSGAFSAMSLGSHISPEEYGNFIEENRDIIKVDDGVLVASVLDVIGDADATWVNQNYFEKRGLPLLPCFHFGEDPKVLDYYVKNYKYITLGGLVAISSTQRKLYLDRLWKEHLVDEQGYPKVKVHGFGLTSVELMERYPWYSVDSSTWVQIAKTGNILFFKNKRAFAFSVSSTSANRKVKGMHITTVSNEQREWCKKEIEKRGFTLEQVADRYEFRWVYNILMFMELEKYYIEERGNTFSLNQPELPLC